MEKVVKVVKVGYQSIELEDFLNEFVECTKENVEQIMNYYPEVNIVDDGRDLVFKTKDNEDIGYLKFDYGVAKNNDLSDVINLIEQLEQVEDYSR